MNQIWIRGQDKRDLVLAKAISVDPAVEHVWDESGMDVSDLEGIFYLVATESDDFTFILGEYPNEENATRVLDAIHAFAAAGCDGVFPVPEADEAD
jgi:hypothetical protein